MVLELNEDWIKEYSKLKIDTAVRSIQKQWKLCRYRTEYKLCRTIVNKELDEIGVEFQ